MNCEATSRSLIAAREIVAQMQRDIENRSTSALVVNDRGMAFSHTITPEMQTEATALADRLEEQDCLADAELVRRLAGLG